MKGKDTPDCVGCGYAFSDYRESVGYWLCERCHSDGIRAYEQAAGVWDRNDEGGQ